MAGSLIYIYWALWSCDWQSDIMLDFVVVWLACFALYSRVAGSLIYMLGFVVM